jgi:hypothetical protein
VVGLGGDRYPGELWDKLWAGVWHVQGLGIPVVEDQVAWLWDGYPGVVWVQFGAGGWFG